MSDPIYGLSAENMQRVADTVRTVEAHPAPPANGRTVPPPPQLEFWALLGTEGTGSNAGKYRWSKVVPQQGGSGLVALSPAVDSGTDYNAVEASSTRGLAGKYVRVRLDAFDSAGKPVYHFAAPSATPPAVFFPVLTTKSGGSDGNASGPATWLYDVTDLGGTALGNGIPQKRRRPKGKRAFATGVSPGVGYFDGGTFCLYEADEVPGTGTCP